MPLSRTPIAIIDIGSNSVRMVVYHALSRVPMPLFNEKYYCALARNLGKTGKLDPEGIAQARRAIARFVLMQQRFKIPQITAIATAAIRDAQDGDAFVKAIAEEFGLQIHVIDGVQEADLAAKGILASLWKPSGLVADLGGGSLELAHVHNGQILQRQSLPIGTLRLLEMGECSTTRRQHIARALAQVPWLSAQPFVSCYAVGGSFRSIAKMHSRECQYPLKLIHEYRLKAASIERISTQLAPLSAQELAALPGIASKRAASIPIAATMLHEIMQATQARHSVFSVAGIREGAAYDQLAPEQQTQDPLIASAEELALLSGRKGRYARELLEWSAPLFPNESPRRLRMRHALCHLSEIAWNIDPNFRSEWAYLRVLQSDMKGLSHRERVTLATAMHYRYAAKWKKDLPETALLDADDRQWAACCGHATNLAFQLSGGQRGNLHHAPLNIQQGKINLHTDDDARPLLTDIVTKRLALLQQTFAQQ